mmetsp:Transcript_41923/g.135684  ORF Transcript_41923/g.135684 Transcript_41923/m.135684 type:complete len:93 (-) Transcript_41923:237-515(-)
MLSLRLASRKTRRAYASFSMCVAQRSFDWPTLKQIAADQIVRILSRYPSLLDLSAKRLVSHMKVLEARGSLTQKSLCTVMRLTDAQFAARFS